MEYASQGESAQESLKVSGQQGQQRAKAWESSGDWFGPPIWTGWEPSQARLCRVCWLDWMHGWLNGGIEGDRGPVWWFTATEQCAGNIKCVNGKHTCYHRHSTTKVCSIWWNTSTRISWIWMWSNPLKISMWTIFLPSVVVEGVITFAFLIVADSFGMFLQPYCTKPGLSPFRTASSLNYSLL